MLCVLGSLALWGALFRLLVDSSIHPPADRSMSDHASCIASSLAALLSFGVVPFFVLFGGARALEHGVI